LGYAVYSGRVVGGRWHIIIYRLLCQKAKHTKYTRKQQHKKCKNQIIAVKDIFGICDRL